MMKLIFEYLPSQSSLEEDILESHPQSGVYMHLPSNCLYVAHTDNIVPQHQGVGFSFEPSSSMSAEDIEHINIALASIYSSLQSHTYHPKTTQHLWSIVNQTTHDSFYDDCKNYVVNINAQQSVFLVSPRFDTPLSVKLNAHGTRLFLWAYLTMLEAPSIKTKLHIELPHDSFTILPQQGEAS